MASSERLKAKRVDTQYLKLFWKSSALAIELNSKVSLRMNLTGLPLTWKTWKSQRI